MIAIVSHCTINFGFDFLIIFHRSVTINLVSYFSYDSLTIYDGSSTSSDLIGKFCGNALPPDQILSSTHELLLHFKTNDAGTYDGFHIEYSSLSKSPPCLKLIIMSKKLGGFGLN